MIEHWVFNRTPIEFNVDATIQFNNGSQFSANSTPTINVWDLAPSRMKIWARLTELKQVFSSYNDDEIDVEKIDLKAFYTRNQVDELIKEQKEFTLLKQMKLYDDLVDDNENEIYRGPVSKFINKGYVATDYDKETETMILDWPDEIGTLPPEALQNNPQIGDYTHAPTADFSAKQQKRITTNENNIKLLETKVDNNIKSIENKIEINKQNIDDIKNNWFNIETSPLWKEISNELSTDNLNKEILVIWGYIYESDIYKYKYTRKSIFKLNEEYSIKSYTLLDTFYSDETNNIRLYLTCSNYKIRASATPRTYYSGFISKIYQYQGTGTPTEFITEESTERDYYTKIETNNLLDKKQDKLIAGENIKIENNVISATSSDGESLWEVNKDNPNFINSKDDKGISANDKRIIDVGTPTFETDATTKEYVDNLLDKKQEKLTAGTNIIIDEDNVISSSGSEIDLSDYYKKEEVDKKLEDTKAQFPIAFQINTISQEIPNLETTNKTVTGGINELKEKIETGFKYIVHDFDLVTEELKKIDKKIINNSNIWEEVGHRLNNYTWVYFILEPFTNYRVFYIYNDNDDKTNPIKKKLEFSTNEAIQDGIFILDNIKKINELYITLKLDIKPLIFNTIFFENCNNDNCYIFTLEKLKKTKINNYKIISNTLDITSPNKINMEKPIKIISNSLETHELEENYWKIEYNIPPTPYIPQWQEVGIREKNKWDNWQITYNFQENKHYRVYYSWSIYNPVYTIQEFIITDNKIAGVQIQTFNDSANIVILSVQHAKLITIYTGKGNLKGNVWKLEELQE